MCLWLLFITQADNNDLLLPVNIDEVYEVLNSTGKNLGPNQFRPMSEPILMCMRSALDFYDLNYFLFKLTFKNYYCKKLFK